MVITTGMIRPSWSLPDVLALKALQKSMMLTPCGPSAVPTGGAGVAFPAGICSFTEPVIFFAIAKNLSLNLYLLPNAGAQLLADLLHLEEIQLHWRRATKNRDQNPKRAAFG